MKEKENVPKITEQRQVNNILKRYSKITDAVKEIDTASKEIRLLLGVVDYDAPYLLHYDVSLHLHPSCNAKNETFDFLSRIDMLHTITILEQKNKAL